MSNPLVSRPAPLPTEAAPYIPIVRCNEKERFQVRFVCLSEAVFGLNIHFARRSAVCLAPTHPCEHCDAGRKWEWKGYLPATDLGLSKRFLVEITNGVNPEIDRFLELWKSLRGRYITLTRPSGHANGRLAIDFATEASTVPAGNLPPCFSVADTLERIYGVPRPEKMQDGSRFNIRTVTAGRSAVEAMNDLVCNAETLPAGTPQSNGQAETNGQA